ncbi:hypothetical protein K8I85_02130 [bacterium]|nr:hypothetical protein [bacterium]
MWKPTITAMLLFLLPAVAPAIDDDQWLHISVNGDEETVRINLPLVTVAAVLPLIDTDEMHRGHVRIDDLDLEHADVKAILNEIRKAKDGEYVTIEEDDETVRIRKQGEFIHIDVREIGRHGEETVQVKVPVKVLDALTAGEEDRLDLLAAIEVLADYEGQDLVTVNDDGETVRIWIDRKSSS